jgi:predicted DNA-binding protein
MVPEKLIDEITVKLSDTQKRRLVALAEADGVSASELVRRLIALHLEERERHFHALNLIFGASATSHQE